MNQAQKTSLVNSSLALMDELNETNGFGDDAFFIEISLDSAIYHGKWKELRNEHDSLSQAIGEFKCGL
jgi:hypothetical protein